MEKENVFENIVSNKVFLLGGKLWEERYRKLDNNIWGLRVFLIEIKKFKVGEYYRSESVVMKVYRVWVGLK